MRRHALAALVAVTFAGCNENTAIGNDRESRLDPVPSPAPVLGAADALENVATAIVRPETMSDADIQALGGKAGRCAVKMTEAGFPSFVYQRGGDGAIKLNGKLISLKRSGDHRYQDGGLSVALRPLDSAGYAGLQEVDMIVTLPGAMDELGYRGYNECGQRDVGAAQNG